MNQRSNALTVLIAQLTNLVYSRTNTYTCTGLEKHFELHLSNGQVRFWFYFQVQTSSLVVQDDELNPSSNDV